MKQLLPFAVWLAIPAGALADPAAEKLMRDAHVVRAGWDQTFPGFTAKLSVNIDGQAATGKLTVSADRKISLELPAGPLADWANHQLDSIVSHRSARVRDKYDVSFTDSETNHPLGRLLKFTGSHSHYRIKGDLITEVHRPIRKGGKFTITVTDVSKNSEGKYLPRAFNVSSWDADGSLIRNRDYHEEWVRVGSFDLPECRLEISTSKGKRSVGELKLSDHQLLKSSPASK